MTAHADLTRRSFLAALGLGAASLACAPPVQTTAEPTRRLRRVGLQLYSLRDDAKRNLERTLADIAAAGYDDVELLGSFGNFGMPPAWHALENFIEIMNEDGRLDEIGNPPMRVESYAK